MRVYRNAVFLSAAIILMVSFPLSSSTPNNAPDTRQPGNVLVPDDTRYGDQDALRSLGLEAAWALTTGGNETVVVGIIDTGMDLDHPDLMANLWTNPGESRFPNGLDDDGSGYTDDINGWDFVDGDNQPFDQDGHGTHVAGIIGAVGNNSRGVSGVNWQVRLLPLRCGVSTMEIAHVVSAIDYAITLKQRGVPIVAINNSYLFTAENVLLEDAVRRAEAAGILMIASAGNLGRDNDLGGTPGYDYGAFPADYPSVLAVANIDLTDQLAADSNYGATRVDLAAPGVSVLSASHTGGYAYDSGTSQAAAFTTGAAALVKALRPELDAAGLRRLINGSTKPVASLDGKVATGGKLAVDRLVFSVQKGSLSDF